MQKIDALTQLLNKLQNSGNPGTIKAPSAFLGQSVPNPSSKSTSINYSITTDYNTAELVVNNIAGQRIKQVQLSKSSLIDIDTSAFSAGTYSYTLMVDARSVDTKKNDSSKIMM